jgi:hypothetical protein
VIKVVHIYPESSLVSTDRIYLVSCCPPPSMSRARALRVTAKGTTQLHVETEIKLLPYRDHRISLLGKSVTAEPWIQIR